MQHRPSSRTVEATAGRPRKGVSSRRARGAAVSAVGGGTEHDKKLDEAIRQDFKVFLCLLWAFLKLPAPSAVQLSMADYLQHGPNRSIIMAFRGCGKSWITAAYALWILYCNPQAKVLVVSGSLKRAVSFTTFCMQIISGWDLLQHLKPRRDQRQSATAFDVGPAAPAQSASLSAFGITGQIVGARADVIIPDDVETNTNSVTAAMREKLADAVREFDAILVPGGRIKFLGTPQSHESIYTKLEERAFEIRIWPMVYPDAKRMQRYGDKLSPFIRNRALGNEGKPTWPGRFNETEVERQRIAWGASGFDLQFMLDTSLSDAGRFPLKLANLIVMSLEKDKGPEELVWSKSDETALSGLPNMGFHGDRYYKPIRIGDVFSPWTSTYATIDPSDKGKDEAAMVIGSELNARVFLRKVKGWKDGTAESTLKAMAALCVEYRVQRLRIESNFGGSMFGLLLKPHLTAAWEEWNKANPHKVGGTSIEDERVGTRTAKEARIIQDLEPVTNAHRLVVDLQVIEDDYREVMASGDEAEGAKAQYSLMHQFANLTYDKDCLAHDDRLDALAALVNLYKDRLGINPSTLSSRNEEERLQEELERLWGQGVDIDTKGNALPPRDIREGRKLSTRHQPGDRGRQRHH